MPREDVLVGAHVTSAARWLTRFARSYANTATRPTADGNTRVVQTHGQCEAVNF